MIEFSTEFLTTLANTMNTCYSSLTGVWGYGTKGAGSYAVYITAAGTTATCPSSVRVLRQP